MKLLPGLAIAIVLLTALPAAPVGQLQEVRFCDGYTIRTYRDAITGEGSFEILHGKEQAFEKAGFDFQIGRRFESDNPEPVLIGQDLTNSGSPHVVIYEWTGGLHSSYIARVFRLGEKCEFLAEINGIHTEPVFRTDGENRPWIVHLRDWAFQYWPHSFATSHAPEVMLTWQGTKYAVARDRMLQPAPAAQELQEIVSRVRMNAGWSAGSMEIPYELYSTALDLMYSGHEELAWPFLREAWKPGFPKEEKFAAELRARRDSSEYWQQFVKAP